MDLGEIEVSPQLRLRNLKGQFIAACEEGAIRAAWRLAKEGQRFAEMLAPYRTGELVESIHAHPAGYAAYVSASAPHARYQEKGTDPHPISTTLAALANLEQGFFVPNPLHPTGMVTVQHPGNPATRFLAESARRAGAMGHQIVHEEMP